MRPEFAVVAGNEAAATTVYMRERSEAVVLQLEDEVVVIERFVQNGQLHRSEAKRSWFSLTLLLRFFNTKMLCLAAAEVWLAACRMVKASQKQRFLDLGGPQRGTTARPPYRPAEHLGHPHTGR